MTTFAASRPAVSVWPRLFAGVGLAVMALAATLAMIRHGGIAPAQPWSGRLDSVSVLLAACSTLPLVMWWRYPLGVLTTTTAAVVTLTALGYPTDVMIGPTVALYFVAASGMRRTPVAVALFGAYLLAAGVEKEGVPGAELLHSGLAWGVAWFAGERTRLRRDQIGSLRQRAERAEQDADRERQLAIAQERARIARDLHDSAGHAISLIAVRAGAARLRHEPSRSLAALEDIEKLARQTAGQIDQLVGTLREHDNDLAAPPGVASLETLIAHHQAAGLTVTAKISGPPPESGSPTDYAVYRIVQEGLTNASRHGSGRAGVTVTFSPSSAGITITNPFTGNGVRRHGGGHGLIGIRERVTLLGGSLSLSASNGTFRIHADVPMRRPA